MGLHEELDEVIDAGGALHRADASRNERSRQLAASRAATERIAKAAGKIPLLETLEAVTEYTSYAQGSIWDRGRKSLLFPALQVAKNLDVGAVFAALAQNHSGGPNVMAERHGEPSVGPHFDNYNLAGFMPWTLHENLRGTGKIRASFIGDKQYEAYVAFAEIVPKNEEAQELMARNRALIGATALRTTHLIYEGDLSPDTRTLIWHGSKQQAPAAHDIVRDELGSYRLYATQLQPTAQLPEGFVHI